MSVNGSILGTLTLYRGFQYHFSKYWTTWGSKRPSKWKPGMGGTFFSLAFSGCLDPLQTGRLITYIVYRPAHNEVLSSPKGQCGNPKSPLSSRCKLPHRIHAPAEGRGPGPEGAGPGLERPSANPGRGAFFSAWPREKDGFWGSVCLTGVAVTPADTSPGSSRRGGGSPRGVRSFSISPGNPTLCQSL